MDANLVLSRLASSQGRRDEVPNQELAETLTDSEDDQAIAVLVEQLAQKDKHLQNDCIKVLYEIGERKPELIGSYFLQFVDLLHHKNNRLQWGAMTALACIAKVRPMETHQHLSKILAAADKGSVITRDQAVNILIELARHENLRDDATRLLFEQLLNSATNQLPMYAERVAPVISTNYKKEFVRVLTTRMGDLDKESKKKRVEKVIKRIKK